jgi:hypothetical protein
MFRIPRDLEIDVDFDQAVVWLKRLKNDSLLDGMEWLSDEWEAYANGDQPEYLDDEEWYENWQCEVNAYNVVAESMMHLFKEK